MTGVAPPVPLASKRDRAYVVVLAGANMGAMYPIVAPGLLLGRGSGADVRLIDEGISRVHARVRVDGDDLLLEDMGSRNGTFCNGVRVTVAHRLREGDKIQLGRTTVLRFAYHDELDEIYQEQMYNSALRDGLTRAFNKRYFTDRLESEFRFAKRHGVPLSLLLLDIDHFKRVNDQCGHLAGDHVLATFADVVQRGVRNEDVFARYGGEEFAIILRAIELADAHQLAERLRAVIEETEFEHNGRRIPVTVCIGLAALPELDAPSPRELIDAADRALYAAKAAGRNRVGVYPEGQGGPAKSELRTEDTEQMI